MRKVQVRAGHIGYRDQLDRVRRFLARVEGPHANDVEFQDIIWSFFQHCTHLQDWLVNDSKVSKEVKAAVCLAVQVRGSPLIICRDMCVATKHLVRKRARPSHVDITITPGAASEMDYFIRIGGRSISGKKLARQCVAEWERILSAQGLAIARLN